MDLDLARTFFRNEQFTDNAEESRLQRAIDTAQRTLEHITDRLFQYNPAASDTLPVFDGYLYPRTLPLLAVSAVTLDGEPLPFDVYDEAVYIQTAQVVRGPFVIRPPDRYTVTYSGGYVMDGEGRNVPADLVDLMGSLTRLFLDVEHSITRADAGFGNQTNARTRNRYSKGGIPTYLYNRAKRYKRRKGRVYNGV